jgi:hypothetical protein
MNAETIKEAGNIIINIITATGTLITVLTTAIGYISGRVHERHEVRKRAAKWEGVKE